MWVWLLKNVTKLIPKLSVAIFGFQVFTSCDIDRLLWCRFMKKKYVALRQCIVN